MHSINIKTFILWCSVVSGQTPHIQTCAWRQLVRGPFFPCVDAYPLTSPEHQACGSLQKQAQRAHQSHSEPLHMHTSIHRHNHSETGAFWNRFKSANLSQSIDLVGVKGDSTDHTLNPHTHTLKYQSHVSAHVFMTDMVILDHSGVVLSILRAPQRTQELVSRRNVHFPSRGCVPCWALENVQITP